MEEKLYKNKDWVYKHYIMLQESTYVMAQRANCSHGTIWNWLCEFDIPTRPAGTKGNFMDLSDKLSDLLEGELLGDGFIGMTSQRSAVYAHSSKYESYLAWLSKEFSDLGFEQSGKIYVRWHKKHNTLSHNYKSRSYPELVPMRKRWYPNGKKIVPEDLVLTPIMARQFYIGDGHLRNQVGARPDIDFSTCSFDKASIDHLLEEFRDKGFIVTHRPSGNKIGMSVYSVKDFLSWIGPCPIDCYSFKWDYQDNRKSMKMQKAG